MNVNSDCLARSNEMLATLVLSENLAGRRLAVELDKDQMDDLLTEFQAISQHL